jgi:hypothetical protein
MARFFQGWQLPAAGLDAGWTWGMNVAAAHGLVFGRQLVFNFGPYAALATGMYDPALRGLIVGGGAVLGVAFTAGLLALVSGRPAGLVATLLMLPLLHVMGALSFALPLPGVLICARARRGTAFPRAETFALLALLPALGLLPLIKGSFLGVSLIGLACLCALLWRAGRRGWAMTAPPIVALSLLCLWCAAGQPAAALPDYFAGMLQIIGGYTDGMSQPAGLSALLAAILPAGVFLVMLAAGARRHPGAAGPVLLAAGALLWLVFKAGYVRADPNHAEDYFSTLGLMFLLLAAWLPRRPGRFAMLAGVFLCAGPLAPDTWRGPKPRMVVTQAWPSLQTAWRVLAEPAAAARRFNAAAARVAPLPWRPGGTADIYSFGQAALFAAGLEWSPRPVFQSYAATTPALARRNAGHLESADAPANIFFRIEPIDGRLPAGEDGPSWPALLSRYDAIGYDGAADIVWLRRADGPAAPPVPGPVLLRAGARMGTPVALPASGAAIWARIDIRPTPAGRLARLLLSAPAPRLRLIFADGHSRGFRLVPGMARAGFLIAPFVATTLDFLRLRAAPDIPGAQPSRPVALQLDPAGGGGWAWQAKYTISLAAMALPLARAVPRTQNVAQPAQAAPAASGGVCGLDATADAGVPAAPLGAGLPVRLTGWALMDRAGRQPASIAVGFQAAGGPLLTVPGAPAARGDIAAHFRLPDADHAGFTATADLSRLPTGDYAVLVLPAADGVVLACRTGATVHNFGAERALFPPGKAR